MKKRVIFLRIVTWIGGIAALVLIVAFLAGAFRNKVAPGVVAEAESHTPVFIRTENVQLVEEPVFEKTPGTLSALRDALISARIMARINEITVRAGDAVTADQVLIRLDNDDLNARMNQANQSVAAAEAQLAEAEKEYTRIKNLVRDGVSAPSKLDTAEAAYRTAKADLSRLQSATQETRIGREWATITAPFAGRIVDRYAEPGNTAMPGQALLKIYDPSRMRLETYVRESLAGSLKPGVSLKVHIDALNLEIEGWVEEIVPQSEPGSRSVLVKVGLPQEDNLYPGMFGRLLIPAGTEKRCYLPKDAIEEVGQLTYVWVVSDNHPAQRRFVKIGDHSKEDRVEIISGLEAGESVFIPKGS